MADLKQSTRLITLNNGEKMPAVGLGTYQKDPAGLHTAIEYALRHGYRHIDTAYGYNNEEEVRDGIRASGVPRDQIWITTKLDNTWHKKVAEGIDASLANLGTDYVDLFLMHWPASLDANDSSKAYEDWDYVDTWREMQKLVGTGKVKTIGVSNFGLTHFEKLLNSPDCKIVPAVNQIELHPGNPSPKLTAYCASKGIVCTAYCPLGSGRSPFYKNESLLAIANAKGKTAAQVLLMWGLQKGFNVIPKSANPERIVANFALDGWSLSDEEMKTIDSLPDRFKICGNGGFPHTIFFGDDE